MNEQNFFAYPYGVGKESRALFGGRFKDGGFVANDDGEYFNIVVRKTKQHGWRRYLVDGRGRKIYEVR